MRAALQKNSSRDTSFLIPRRPKRKYERFNEQKRTRPDFSKSYSTRATKQGHWLRNWLNSIFDFKFNHDKKLFYGFMVIIFVGIISVFSSSIIFSYRNNDGNQFYDFFKHIAFLAGGGLMFAIFYFIRPEVFVKLWWLALSVSIGLLLLTLVLAQLGKNESIEGVNRWLQIGGVQFQPSDFAKLAFVIFVAAYLSKRKLHYKDFSEYLTENLVPYLIWVGLILILILAGKNLSTAMVIGFMALACYGVSVVSKYHKYGFMILLGVMILGGIVGSQVGYRADRLKVLFNYWKTGDTALVDQYGNLTRLDDSYQFDQTLVTLGSGGLTGVGLGESKGKHFLPKRTASDDGAIAVIGEELGFLMTAALILLFLYLILRCVTIAYNFADQPIYFYLMIGCCSWIGFQMITHIGANIGLVPLTGQTLPFISLGGSSLVALMGALGLILNISKQEVVNKKEGREGFAHRRIIG